MQNVFGLKKIGICGNNILASKFQVFVKRTMKIISGGQTGVDRAALDAAIACGVSYAGWCPRGRRAEGGVIPEKYNLTEHESPEYKDRTRQNVIDSDATAIIYSADLCGGTAATYAFCRKYGKPYLLINAADATPKVAAKRLRDFVLQHAIVVLNVAGPRASQWAGAYAYAKKLFEVFLT